MYIGESWGMCTRIDFNVVYQEEQIIILYQAEFFDIGALLKIIGLISLYSQNVLQQFNLTETWTQWWPMSNEAEIPVFLRHNIEKGIQRFRKTGMLGWVYLV